MSRDFTPAPSELLINPRTAMAQPAPTSLQLQIAILIDFNSLGASEFQTDGAPRGAWRDHEIVLKLVLVAVIDQVDAGIEAGVADFFEQRHAQSPAAWRADQMICTAGLRPGGLRGHVPTRTRQAHGDLRLRVGCARA